jgi:hypothetical protein
MDMMGADTVRGAEAQQEARKDAGRAATQQYDLF